MVELSIEFPKQVFSKPEPRTFQVIEKFEKVYHREFLEDERRFHEKDSVHTRYRVLKEVLRSTSFSSEKFENEDIRVLADYLLKDEKLAEPFKDWIRTRSLEWERKTLPKNSYRLYALGKNKVKK